MTRAPDAIVCVENGCDPEEVAVVQSEAPNNVIVVVSQQNIGFAPAVNLGMQVAIQGGADWVLLLNNDAVVEPACLDRCLSTALARPRVAAVGPAISFADRPDLLWFAGGKASSWFAVTRHKGLMHSASSPPPSSDTDFVTGCCMLVSVDAWQRVGAFREDFFAYYEDAEWCLRARESGWHCVYVGDVLCTHAVSVSAARSNGLSEITAYYMARNVLRFALDSKRLERRITRTLGVMIIWNAYFALRLMQTRKAVVTTAYIRGFLDALRGRMGPVR